MNNVCIFKGFLETFFILLCNIWTWIIYILYSIFTCIFWTRNINKWSSEHVCMTKGGDLVHKKISSFAWKSGLWEVQHFCLKECHPCSDSTNGRSRLWEESQWRGEVYRWVLKGYHVFYLSYISYHKHKFKFLSLLHSLFCRREKQLLYSYFAVGLLKCLAKLWRPVIKTYNNYRIWVARVHFTVKTPELFCRVDGFSQ